MSSATPLWDPQASYERVALEDLTVELQVGINQWERTPGKAQRRWSRSRCSAIAARSPARASPTASTTTACTAISPPLDPARAHIDLLEPLLEELVAVCFEDARVEACRVAIRKPHVYNGHAVRSRCTVCAPIRAHGPAPDRRKVRSWPTAAPNLHVPPKGICPCRRAPDALGPIAGDLVPCEMSLPRWNRRSSCRAERRTPYGRWILWVQQGAATALPGPAQAAICHRPSVPAAAERGKIGLQSLVAGE